MIGQAFAGTHLATDWVSENSTLATAEVAEAYESILNAQGSALDKMSEQKASQKILPFGFNMNEMVTDMAVTKSGLLGLAAMKANTGVEIKWKKIASLKAIENENVDFVIESEVSDAEVGDIADSIRNVVLASGKIKDSTQLRSNIHEALQKVREQVKGIEVTTYNQWQARSLRLDLNFGVNGKVFFFAKAGVALRLRMEWKLKEVALTNNKLASLNDQTKFVVKTLAELNVALAKVSVPGFEPSKVMIGVGVSHKRNFFGIWKYSAGFVGWLGFVPVNVSNNKSIVPVNIPVTLLNEEFTIGGTDEAAAFKIWWPWRKRTITHTSFATGMEKSVQTAAFFAQRADANSSAHWRVEEVKTVNDISHTGFFGLADLSARGIVEIDFKRK